MNINTYRYLVLSHIQSLKVLEYHLEFFEGYVSILINIVLIEHFLNVLQVHSVTQLTHSSDDVLCCDLTDRVCIELIEDRMQSFFR